MFSQKQILDVLFYNTINYLIKSFNIKFERLLQFLFNTYFGNYFRNEFSIKK